MTTLRVGAQPNEGYQMVLTAGSSGIDLSTVSSAVIRVLGPDDIETEWAVGLSAQSSSTLTLTHIFSVDQLVEPGNYRVYAELTVPGGIERSAPTAITVVGRFDI